MKAFKTVFIAVFIAVLFSGCGSASRLNDMTVVQSAALDFEENEVVFTIQYLDLNKGSGKNEGLNSSLTANAQGRGKTLIQAVNKLAKTMPDDIFMGQAKLIVIGDGFYSNRLRMNELKNELLRNNNVRCDMLIVRSETGYKVLECGFRNEHVPIDGLCKELKSENRLVTVNDYLADNNTPLPAAEVRKDSGYIIKRR